LHRLVGLKPPDLPSQVVGITGVSHYAFVSFKTQLGQNLWPSQTIGWCSACLHHSLMDLLSSDLFIPLP
jgi:hypothetical protein